MTDESFCIDAQSQHKQLAVTALLLRAPVFGLLASVFPSFKVKVGQGKEHDTVGQVEQLICFPAEMCLQLVFQLIEVRLITTLK